MALGPTEMYILFSILGLFAFSCVCFTFCCDCFGRRRTRNGSNDACLYCLFWPDCDPLCCLSPAASHTAVPVGDCDAAGVTAVPIHHGSCFGCCDCDGDGGCCEGQEGCCDGSGNTDAGGCCDGGADVGDAGGCCDGCDSGGCDCSGCDLGAC